MRASRRVDRRGVLRLDSDEQHRSRDELAVEEPLEIRVAGETVAVTMRTPGNDFDLAVGFCLTEGIVDHPGDVATARYCAGVDPVTGLQTYNVVDVALRRAVPVAERLRRNVYMSSSCGICGTASIEGVRKATPDVSGDPLQVPVATLVALPGRLREAQAVFDRTGGLHAAGVFNAGGEAVCVREDVGRHNAVDKVVGWAATAGRLPLSGHLLMVSGRIAFEIVQKALRAGIPFVAAVSAPTSLAVSLAEEAGVTLVGFLRGETMNVYARPERIIS
jgi:FdhD protein